MKAQKKVQGYEVWLSTYAYLTAQRILDILQIKLPHDYLIKITKHHENIFHQMLRVPLKNVYNGLIWQQAYDYQAYAQTMFVDYLMSGQSDLGEDAAGSYTREALEKERKELVRLGEEFEALEKKHKTLIAQSQKTLFAFTGELRKIIQTKSKEMISAFDISDSKKKVKQTLKSALVDSDIHEQYVLPESSSGWQLLQESLNLSNDAKTIERINHMLEPIKTLYESKREELDDYYLKAEDISVEFVQYRQSFYDLILRASNLIRSLPDYKINEEDTALRSRLDFDKVGL